MSYGREKFEQAVKDQWSDSFNFKRGIDSFYLDETLAGMWWGWRVSRRVLSSRQELEGVPTAIIHKTSPGEYGFYPATGAVSLANGMHKLYTHPASDVLDAEYIRALQDAFDIIQADANTEQNYGSLCRMGWVLARLKSVQEQDDE